MIANVSSFVLNGRVHGGMADAFPGERFDPGLSRPFIGRDGRQYCVVNTGRTVYDRRTRREVPEYQKVLTSELIHNGLNNPVFNSTSLRKDEWLAVDKAVLTAARKRLRAWTDLAASSKVSINGMSKMLLEHETMSDPGEAVVDMDGLTDARTDSPLYNLEGIPLPITHAGFWFSERRLAISRNSGTPLDTTMSEAAGRRVAETIEKTLIGMISGITYGSSSAYGRTPTVYGYTNFPNRIVFSGLPTPTGSNQTTILSKVLSMRDALADTNMYGPYMIYYSKDWDATLDADYVSSGGNNPNQTLRQRILAVDGIQGMRRLDYFTTAYSMLMIQMTSDVAEAIEGMPLTTVQWRSHGDMKVNFRVMAIQVPRLKADFNGNCGILHAIAS